jgi:hypothetical protein
MSLYNREKKKTKRRAYRRGVRGKEERRVQLSGGEESSTVRR